jgi:serine/threonine protein kinase
VQIGDFHIVKHLGSGGMGVVYLARQASLKRLVALKVLGTSLSDHWEIARFQRQAQAVARLNHPGIATLYFVGQDGHVCYLAMEYIEGITLRNVITYLYNANNSALGINDVVRTIPAGEGVAPVARFDGPTIDHASGPAAALNPVQPGCPSAEATRLIASPVYIRHCCEIVRDVALALSHAHQRGVIHRDIKPENILLDKDGHVHLIDFGLARFFEDVTLTNTGALVGTPMYMSPEQVTGRLNVDGRSDIYSLGIILYEMLTLRRPHVVTTRAGLLRQIVTKPMPPLSWKNRAVSMDLESVVHRAIAIDPDDRYPTADSMLSDIESILSGNPVSARPYSYKFDNGDILLSRPKLVTIVALYFFFGFLWLSLNILLGFYNWYSFSDSDTSALNIISYKLIIMCPISTDDAERFRNTRSWTDLLGLLSKEVEPAAQSSPKKPASTRPAGTKRLAEPPGSPTRVTWHLSPVYESESWGANRGRSREYVNTYNGILSHEYTTEISIMLILAIIAILGCYGLLNAKNWSPLICILGLGTSGLLCIFVLIQITTIRSLMMSALIPAPYRQGLLFAYGASFLSECMVTLLGVLLWGECRPIMKAVLLRKAILLGMLMLIILMFITPLLLAAINSVAINLPLDVNIGQNEIWYSILLLLSNICIFIICLDPVQCWFGLAKQLREEHRKQAVAS